MRWPWFWYLPGGLLILVACHQLRLAHTADLSPWSGGGFGMFSATDSGANRHLHAFALNPGIRRERRIPAKFEEAEKRLLTLPTDDRLRAFALDLAAHSHPDRGPVEAIELQIWTTRYDADTLEPGGTLLRGFTVRVDGR